MRDQFFCPTCSQALHAKVRSLDFFCRSCFTTLVVIDERWSHVMRVGERAPRLVPTERCRRVRHTEPLSPASPTGALAS